MMATPHTSAPHDPAPGWDEADVRMLERLAALGMGMAEALAAPALEPQAEPMTQADAAKVAQAFTVIARCVRFTLALKARARGAGGEAAAPRPVEDPDDLWFGVDPDDPQALTHDALVRRSAAEVRLAFEHVITDPANIDLCDPQNALAERNRLREGLERCIERESEHERFRLGPAPDMIKRICDELGLIWDCDVLYDSRHKPQAWIVGRPHDPQTEVVWRGAGPYHNRFLTPWRPPREPP
jgi:hypothetical protein